MTTIAVRSGIMACDSAWSDGNGTLVTLQTKITRTKHGALVGGAGDCSDFDVMRLLEKVRRPVDFPPLADLMAACHAKSDLEFLIYFPDRQIWTFAKGEDSAGELFRIKAPFAAIGSGATAAKVAMSLKASAIRAIQAACEWDMNCRPPVHYEGVGKLTVRRKRV